MSDFEIVVEGSAPAFYHMQADSDLVRRGRSWPVLRLYEWQKFSITTGLFIDSSKFIRSSECCRLGIDVVKRPTGGGLLFHGTHDLAFSLFFPSEHPIAKGSVQQSCMHLNEILLGIVQPYLAPQKEGICEIDVRRCQLCMAQVTLFDILWSGYKIGGCAQRRTKRGLLHQVSLFLHAPDWEIIESIMRQKKDVEAMKTASKSFEECALSTLCTRETLVEEIIRGVKLYE